MDKWECPELFENCVVALPYGRSALVHVLPPHLQAVADLLHQSATADHGEERCVMSVPTGGPCADPGIIVVRLFKSEVPEEAEAEQRGIRVMMVDKAAGECVRIKQACLERYGAERIHCYHSDAAMDSLMLTITGTYEEVDVHDVVRILAQNLTAATFGPTADA